MPSVIVSVKLKGEVKEYDLEVPADVPAQKLAELIMHNLDPKATTKGALTVRCLKPGAVQMLAPEVTLAEAGLWDGVFLEIGPTDTVLPATWADILLVWEPLDLDASPSKPIHRPADPGPKKAKPAPPPQQKVEKPPPPPPVQFDPIFSEEEKRRLGMSGDSGATDEAGDDGDHLPPAR
jgi:hypothetical protein